MIKMMQAGVLFMLPLLLAGMRLNALLGRGAPVIIMAVLPYIMQLPKAGTRSLSCSWKAGQPRRLGPL